MDWIAVLWCFTLLCLAGVVNAASVNITEPDSDRVVHKTTGEAVIVVVISSNLDRYSWSQEPDDGSFNYNQTYPMLVITNATELNDGVYTITVTAHGTDGSSDLRTIVFNVTTAHTETNQHAPVFEALQGQIYIVEWEEKGASVLQVTATDADEARPDNEVTYSIAGDDFSINSTTGLVSLQTKLNYTVKAEYELVITATDGGTPPKSASITATATVQTRPRWLSPDPDQNVSVAINETYLNQSIQVYTLSATDDDNSAVLTYTLLSQEPNTTVNKFVVEGDTVITNPNVTLDIDVDDPVLSYNLTLRVQDEQFTADAILKVLVVGGNQHPPNFTQDEYKATIDRKYPLHAIILQVNATDPDNKRESGNLSADNSQLVNSKVSYTLLNESEIFYLHPIYGTLALRQRPNGTEYSLTIIASDDDKPPKLSYAAVIIQVTDEPSYIGLAFGIVGAVAVLIAAVGIGSCVYMSKKAKHWDKKLLTEETLKSKTKAQKKDGSLRFTEVK